jgi:hypothetical protein
MTVTDTNDAETLGLRALAWILGDDARATRFLTLTGLAADDLRGRIGAPETLAAALRFLEAHEPDLVACAGALGIDPAALPVARRRLEA